MLKQPLLASGLALASCVVAIILLWVMPLSGPLASSFSAGAIHAHESTPYLGTYSWAAPQGRLRVPLLWWADRVIVRQQLSAGPLVRELVLRTARGDLRFTLAAGQIRTYRYLVPTGGGWLEAGYAIPPLGPSAGEPRELGMIISDSKIDHLRGARWPGPGLLALVLLVPLAERAGSAWGLGRLRWALALALAATALLSYRADGIQTLAIGPALAFGLMLAGAGGWLLGRLRGQLGSWPGLALALSLAYTLVPLLLTGIGLGGALPSAAWPLLGGPMLIALALALVPGAVRYRAPLAGVAVGCALIWAGLYGYVDAIIRSPSDFRAYYEAAQRLGSGLPLYDIGALAANPFATTYKYPPIGALLIRPLTQLSLPAAGTVWRALCVVAAAAGAGALAMRSARPGRPRAYLGIIALTLLATLSPVARSLRFGQPELLIVAAAVLGTALLLRGRIWPSAAVWALLALVKIYPLLLVLPLLLVGRRRWTLALITCLLGWTAFSSASGGWDLPYWRDLFPLLGARDGRLSNLAIYGVAARLIDPASYSGGVAVPAAALPAFLLGGGMYALTALLLWRRRATLGAQVWDGLGMMVCVVLLVIPVSWDHYHALLLLPLIVSMGALGSAGDAAMLWLGAYTLLIFGVSRDIWPTDGAMPGALSMFFGSYRAVGVLLLWAWFARRFGLRLDADYGGVKSEFCGEGQALAAPRPAPQSL